MRSLLFILAWLLSRTGMPWIGIGISLDTNTQGAVMVGSRHILTEASDTLTTEAGDQLRTET